MPNCVCYRRVSSKEQAIEGGSLETQYQVCREKVAQLGYTVVEEFADEGESAKTTDRQGLRDLLDYCAKHHKTIDALVIYKIDRLARSTEDYTVLRTLFKRLNIKIISVSEKIETTPSGRFLEVMLAAVAEFDNENRAENCRSGMIAAVTEGRWVWRSPLGFRNGEVLGKKNIVPIEPQAGFILRAFEMIASGGYRCEETRRILTVEGFRQVNGQPISKTHFTNLLRKKVYCGIIDKFGLEVQGSFQIIIPIDLFKKVQAVLDGKPARTPRYFQIHPDFPLKGTLKCEKCDHFLSASWSTGRKTKYPFYHCTRCKGKGNSRKKSDAEAAFYELLKQHELKPEMSELLKLAITAKWEQRIERNRTEKAQLDHELVRVELQRKQLVLRDLEGAYPNREVVIDLLKEFDEKIIDIKDKITDNQKIEGLSEEVVRFGLKKMERLGDEWLAAEINTKRRFQNFFYPAGLVYDRNKKFGTASPLLLMQLKKTFREEKSLAGGPCRARTGDLLDAIEALWPTELMAHNRLEYSSVALTFQALLERYCFTSLNLRLVKRVNPTQTSAKDRYIVPKGH